MTTFEPSAWPKRADVLEAEIGTYVDTRIPQASAAGKIAVSTADGDIVWTTIDAGVLGDIATQAELDAHAADTTAVHGITDTTALALTADARFPSSGEKAALAGTSGTPGSGNKYVTAADVLSTSSLTAAARLDLRGVFNVRDVAYAGGAVGDGVALDHAAIQAAITAAAGAGTVYLPPGTYKITNSLLLPKNATGLRVVGAGVGATTILCSGTGSGRRAFDLNRTADGDVFQNIEISDMTIDANNIAGTHHVIVGTMQDGSMQSRVNINGFVVRRVKAINVPVGALSYGRIGVGFFCWHGTAGETQGYIRNVLCEDVNIQGGQRGFACLGAYPFRDGTWPNVYVDNIFYIRCTHSLLTAVPNPGGYTNFHVGSQGHGGRFYAQGCYGYGSGDTGFDVDSMTEAYMVDCLIEDCANVPYYFPNFSYPGLDDGLATSSSHNLVAEQRFIAERCHARTTSSTMVSAGGAFQAESPAGDGSIPLGAMILRDCSYYRNTSGASFDGEAVSVKGTMKELLVDGFRCITPNVTAAAGYPRNLLKTISGAGPTSQNLRNVTFEHPSV